MARTSGRKGRPWRRAVEAVKRRSQVCHICLEAIDLELKFPDPMSFSVDHHPIPLSEMSEDDPRRTDPNFLEPAHLGCNASKGTGDLDSARARKTGGEPIATRTSRDWF